MKSGVKSMQSIGKTLEEKKWRGGLDWIKTLYACTKFSNNPDTCHTEKPTKQTNKLIKSETIRNFQVWNKSRSQ